MYLQGRDKVRTTSNVYYRGQWGFLNLGKFKGNAEWWGWWVILYPSNKNGYKHLKLLWVVYNNWDKGVWGIQPLVYADNFTLFLS